MWWSAFSRQLKPLVESHDYRLHARLDRIAEAMLWRSKCDLFNQTIVSNPDTRTRFRVRWWNWKIESRIGFQMERDEIRIGFRGHVIAVSPNPNETPNKLGLVRDSVR